MALNLTGIDIDLYFTVGSVVNGLVLFAITCPDSAVSNCYLACK